MRYYGYGGLSVAQLTQQIRGISKLVLSAGEHSIALPSFNVADTVEDARALLDMLSMRAEEMGWIIHDAEVVESGRGFRAHASLTVPPGAGPMPDTVPAAKDGPSVGSVVLAVGIGAVGLGALLWAGTKA